MYNELSEFAVRTHATDAGPRLLGPARGGLRARDGHINGIGPALAPNGGSLHPGIRRRPGSKRGLARIKGGSVAALVFVTLMLGILMVVLRPLPREPIGIDGKFDDWSSVVAVKSGSVSDDASCAIRDVAVLAQRVDRLYLRVAMEGPAFGRDGSAASYRLGAFVDTDRDPASGFLLPGLGADLLWTAVGWEGKAAGSSVQEFASGRPQHDFAGFSGYAGVSVASAGNEVEVAIPAPSGTEIGSDPVVLAFCGVGADVFPADAPASPRRPTLLVSYSGGVPDSVDSVTETLAIVFEARGGPVEVLGAKAAAGSLLASGATAKFPIEIPSGGRAVLALRVSPSDADADGTIPFGLSSVDAPAALVSMPALAGRSYAGSPPSEPVVDGAFGDWAARPGLWLSDPASDQSPPSATATDLLAASATPSGPVLAFFANVSGDFLSGGLVQRGVVIRDPSPGGGGPPISQPATDSAAFYVDVDGPAGAPSPLLGADYRLVVTGRAGRVIDESWERWTGSWTPVPGVPVGARTDRHRLEASVPDSATGGRSALALAVVVTDWSGGWDGASAAGAVLFAPPVPNVVDGYVSTGSPGVGLNGATVSVTLECGATIYGPAMTISANDAGGAPGYYYVVIETDPDLTCTPIVTVTCNSGPCSGSSNSVTGAAQTTPAVWSINVNVPERLMAAAPAVSMVFVGLAISMRARSLVRGEPSKAASALVRGA